MNALRLIRCCSVGFGSENAWTWLWIFVHALCYISNFQGISENVLFFAIDIQCEVFVSALDDSVWAIIRSLKWLSVRLCCNGACVCLWNFDDWQAWHSLHHFRISRFMPWHTKRSVMAFWLGRGPACERLWMLWKTSLVQDVGKIVRGVPVEISHSTADLPIWTSRRISPVVALWYIDISPDCFCWQASFSKSPIGKFWRVERVMLLWWSSFVSEIHPRFASSAFCSKLILFIFDRASATTVSWEIFYFIHKKTALKHGNLG